MRKSTSFKNKNKKNYETYFPIINCLMFLFGIFLLGLLYQKWNTYDTSYRISLLCMGIGFILFGVSKRFRFLSSGILCLLALILVLSVGFSDLWTGAVAFDFSHFVGIIVLILFFGVSAAFLLSMFFKTFHLFGNQELNMKIVFWIKNIIKLIVGVVSFVFGGFLCLGFFIVDDSFKFAGSVPLFVAVVLLFLGIILLISFAFSNKRGYNPLAHCDFSLAGLDIMTGPEFEQCCAEILRRNGFYDVEVMGGSGDQGVDIIATKDKLRYAVQCKCYSSNLGNTPVQEVFAGKIYYGCDVAAVMTNSYFTAGAYELASSTGVLLWDRDWVSKHLSMKKRQKERKDISTVAEIAPVEESPITALEPEPVSEMGSVKNEKPLEEILEKTKAERMAKLEEIREEIRKKEKQEEYLKTIYGEEMKWRREQLHGGNDEDNQE